jgi:excinuclease UvrABC helicase subunit UvrB
MNLNPFATKDVASVVKQFTKAISELESIQDACAKDNDNLAKQIDELKAKEVVNDAEFTKALKIRQNLEKLLNGES